MYVCCGLLWCVFLFRGLSCCGSVCLCVCRLLFVRVVRLLLFRLVFVCDCVVCSLYRVFGGCCVFALASVRVHSVCVVCRCPLCVYCSYVVVVLSCVPVVCVVVVVCCIVCRVRVSPDVFVLEHRPLLC